MAAKKKKEPVELDVDEEEVVRVLKLIEKMRENNKTEFQIEKELLKIGYSQDFVNKALGKAPKKAEGKKKKEEDEMLVEKPELPPEYQVKSRKLQYFVMLILLVAAVCIFLYIMGIVDFSSLLNLQ